MIPTTSPQDKATQDLVKRAARTRSCPDALAGTGVTAQVGGVTAALEDQSEYIVDRMPLFIAGVVGLSFLLLLVAFHSPLISLKAAVMNLLSVSAAYGVMTLVAQGGAVGELIGIDHEVPIAPFMPVMMFAILFGLSMDYEVFLISRIREEYLKDGDTRRAVADGLAKTARVITAAAAIMVVVFLAFVASPEVFLKLFGIGLAAAIFLDATVVRMVLVPGGDAAARRPQLVDPGLARAAAAAARRRASGARGGLKGEEARGPAISPAFAVYMTANAGMAQSSPGQRPVPMAKARRAPRSVRPLSRRKIAPSSSSAAISFGQETSRRSGLGGSSSSTRLQTRSKSFAPTSPARSPAPILIGAKRSFIEPGSATPFEPPAKRSARGRSPSLADCEISPMRLTSRIAGRRKGRGGGAGFRVPPTRPP